MQDVSGTGTTCIKLTKTQPASVDLLDSDRFDPSICCRSLSPKPEVVRCPDVRSGINAHCHGPLSVLIASTCTAGTSQPHTTKDNPPAAAVPHVTDAPVSQPRPWAPNPVLDVLPL